MTPPGHPHRRRQRSDARRNRAEIVATAVRALQRDSELSMRAVAEAAGVSRSTLYRHFPTRESLEQALREDALAAIGATIAAILAEERPALAALRRLIQGLAAMASERRLELLTVLPLPHATYDPAPALLPMLEHIRLAADLEPRPPQAWLGTAARHLVDGCLRLGTRPPDALASAADELFGLLTDPLDQGLVILDPSGSLLGVNPAAARLLARAGVLKAGDPLTEPEMDVVYEDGSPCPGTAYPLSVAIRTGESQRAVRGHRVPASVKWVSINAVVLRTSEDRSVYGVLGVLSDVTSEKEWALGHLRPAGELAAPRPVPLDIVRVLDDIPAPLFPEQFVSEARRICGAPVALYVLDIDGTHLLRLAGPEEFPDRLEAPLALGPELAEDGIPDLKARLERELPDVTVAPMWLRGRAVGLLLGLRVPEQPLVELGRHGAAAMELASGYTDVFDAARRRKETRPAAELQQSLLPPRIARMGGGVVAGSVLPSYEVGGDWFDYVENRDGAWIAIGDAVGKGTTAGALSGIALAALRAARRSDESLEGAAMTMHEAIHEVGGPEFFVTAIIARWHAVYSTFSWINCGHPPPLVVGAEGTIEQLKSGPTPPLGLPERDRRFTRSQRRLDPDERLILHSDGITARRTKDGQFGLEGVERAVRAATSRSATAIARSIQEAVMRASEDPLEDDAVTVVLAPADGG